MNLAVTAIQNTKVNRLSPDYANVSKRFGSDGEHQIRDDKDFKQHVEYIHYNPVKHGLVYAPKDWEFSRFHRYVREGLYDIHWGAGEAIHFVQGIWNE